MVWLILARILLGLAYCLIGQFVATIFFSNSFRLPHGKDGRSCNRSCFRLQNINRRRVQFRLYSIHAAEASGPVRSVAILIYEG